MVYGCPEKVTNV